MTKQAKIEALQREIETLKAKMDRVSGYERYFSNSRQSSTW